jgi:hypothetical protein
VAVSRYLRGRAEPTRTADLLAHLDSLGIPIGGQDRSSNLSAMLSHSSGFKSHGRAGWTYEGSEMQEAADGEPEEVTPAAPNRIRTDHPDHHQAEGREAVPGGGT